MPKETTMPKEPTINLTQLISQLRKFEGETIYSAAGLAMTIMSGVREDEPTDRYR